MKCPNCQSRALDIHDAGGFTSEQSPIKECETCGEIWRLIPHGDGSKEIDVIKQGRPVSEMS